MSEGLFRVRLSQFEGPLDLLLHLISKAKINIKDIFISQITQQYLESVSDLTGLDMETASEFLAMAATLLEIKSKSLLPKPPKPQEEEPTEEELIKRLSDYKLFKDAALRMKMLEGDALKTFFKLPEEFVLPPQPYVITNMTLDDIATAMRNVLGRENIQQEETPVRSIHRDIYTVSMGIKRITRRLRKGAFDFSELFSPNPERDEVITVFIALLELLKQNRARVLQNEIGGELHIFPASRKNSGEKEETDGL